MENFVNLAKKMELLFGLFTFLLVVGGTSGHLNLYLNLQEVTRLLGKLIVCYCLLVGVNPIAL